MKIVGLIAEYNPFHYGHLYHLQKAKEVTSSAGSVAVMSGDFVQRGEPAIADKYARARMALEAGVDAVLELPVYYATGSAERFAAGAVGILHALGCVENVVYGCEGRPEKAAQTGPDVSATKDAAKNCPLISEQDDALIKRVAELLAEEPEEYRLALKEKLSGGAGFPAARAAAAELIIPGAADILSAPNNILAVEYEKAIRRLGSHLCGTGIRRSDAGYHESGSAIRRAIEDIDGEDGNGSHVRRAIDELGADSGLLHLMPESSVKGLEWRVRSDDLSSILAHRLITLNTDELTQFEDVSPELAVRISRLCGECIGFDEAVERLCAKNLPAARARRALLHILLGIGSRADSGYALPFIRVLGLRKNSTVMRELTDSSRLPLVTKLADAPEGLWNEDHRASRVYSRILFDKYGLRRPDDYHSSPVII